MTSRTPRTQAAQLGAVILALSLGGCGLTDWLSDRFQTCHDTTVHLVNSEQTLGGIDLLADGETASAETYLASGASRAIVQCVERGNGYHYRAELSGQLLASVNCPASEARYEVPTPSVVWTPVGFRCVDW
jgi:hypothetical protein